MARIVEELFAAQLVSCGLERFFLGLVLLPRMMRGCLMPYSLGDDDWARTLWLNAPKPNSCSLYQASMLVHDVDSTPLFVAAGVSDITTKRCLTPVVVVAPHCAAPQRPCQYHVYLVLRLLRYDQGRHHQLPSTIRLLPIAHRNDPPRPVLLGTNDPSSCRLSLFVVRDIDMRDTCESCHPSIPTTNGRVGSLHSSSPTANGPLLYIHIYP